LDTYRPKSSPRDGIEDRILKQILLEMISIDDSGDSHVLIRNHFSASTTATDRVGALIAINRSSMDERLAVMEETYTKWNGHVSAYANYLRIISSGWKNDVFEMIEKERNRPTFDITNPTLSRALLMTMAGNSKKIWSPAGVEWASRTVVELASINTYIASKLLNVFQDFKRMRPNLKPLVQDALQSVVDQVPDHVSPTVSRQARSYLE
jgi:aminopeptidase N